jgi:general secretion pathway protein M
MKQFSLNWVPLKTAIFKATQPLSKLQPRERKIVAAAGVVALVLLVLQVIVFPMIDSGAKFRQQIVAKKSDLREIQTLKNEYEKLTSGGRDIDSDMKRRPKGFTLFSFLDGLAGRGGIKQNIVYMKPSTANIKNSAYTLSIVEVKAQSLTMAQLVTFLHGIENSVERVWVKRMSIAKDEGSAGLLTSVLQVETYQQ